MNRFAWITSAAVLVGASTLLAVQEAPDFSDMPGPQKEHEWLQQFVGEWTTEGEMMMGPEETFKATGSESVRSVGGRWIISDIRGDSPMGPMQGVMTLGYDPDKGKFIGSWVDSMINHMWIYEGTLDAEGKVLTLNTTGPDMMNPGKSAEYQDVIEIRSPDHRVLTSRAKDQNGEWVAFGTIHFRRAK